VSKKTKAQKKGQETNSGARQSIKPQRQRHRSDIVPRREKRNMVVQTDAHPTDKDDDATPTTREETEMEVRNDSTIAAMAGNSHKLRTRHQHALSEEVGQFVSKTSRLC
jgi:hypothetical protein